MSDTSEIGEVIGQTWVRPANFRGNGNYPFPGNVAIETNQGWLLLANVERIQTYVKGMGFTGARIRHRLVTIDEVPTYHE